MSRFLNHFIYFCMYFSFLKGRLLIMRKTIGRESISKNNPPVKSAELLLRSCIVARYMEWFDYTLQAAPLLPSLTNKYFSNLPLSFLFSRRASVSLGVNLHALSLLSLCWNFTEQLIFCSVCMRLHKVEHPTSLNPLGYVFHWSCLLFLKTFFFLHESMLLYFKWPVLMVLWYYFS